MPSSAFICLHVCSPGGRWVYLISRPISRQRLKLVLHTQVIIPNKVSHIVSFQRIMVLCPRYVRRMHHSPYHCIHFLLCCQASQISSIPTISTIIICKISFFVHGFLICQLTPTSKVHRRNRRMILLCQHFTLFWFPLRMLQCLIFSSPLGF